MTTFLRQTKEGLVSPDSMHSFLDDVNLQSLSLTQIEERLPLLPFRGAALMLQLITSGEVIISGPYETGKTIAALHFIDTLARTQKGLRGSIIRKVRKDLDSTVLETFRKHILRHDVTTFGGSIPQWFDYPKTKSRIFVGGMDRPGSALSGERDIIYVNQAEELRLQDWETFSTRITGRAGVLRPGILLGDANPGPPAHWIKQREEIKLLESRHEDNPLLFDEDGKRTEQGGLTMAILDALTGVRYKRGRLGLWVAAEGQVYEDYDAAIHRLTERHKIPNGVRRIRIVDFGYTNPFVCQWWYIDSDGRMIKYREIYMTRRLVSEHARQIVSLSEGERIEATICDHDAEGRATLESNGIPTIAARKSINTGIEKVQLRLRVQPDGKPRLMEIPNCLVERDAQLVTARKPWRTEDEWGAYIYPEGADGKTLKEVPVDADNHGMDCARYGVMYLDTASNKLPDQPKKPSRFEKMQDGQHKRGKSRWKKYG